MPMPKTDSYWVQRIHSLASDEEKPSAIYPALVSEGQRLGRGDYPSDRQVRREYAKWKLFPDEVKWEQSRFKWPRAMEQGLLPWEAARPVLDFVRYCRDNRLEHPSVRQCKWFWRVRLAAPDLPLPDAHWLAGNLSVSEYLRVTKLGTLEIGSLEKSDITEHLAYQDGRGMAARFAGTHEGRLAAEKERFGLARAAEIEKALSKKEGDQTNG